MNREIKFRVWDGKEMVSLSIAIKRDLVGVQHDKEDGFELEPYYDGVVIMQYTGLKDKNGKEIYEGDVVRTAKGVTQVIAWADYYSAFVAEIPGGDSPYRIDTSDEIIGNIHENPELLEAQND